MVVQSKVWLLTLAGVAIVTLGFIFVIARSGDPTAASQAQKGSKAGQGWLLLALIVLGIGVAWATLKPFPIPDQRAPLQATQVVDAVGRQWFWALSTKRIAAGVPVEFRVTSADVNHGFAIYGPDGRVVTQTQGMPGYTNKLLHTFHQPGKYRVMCLEYCGLGHHVMEAEFEVVAGGEGERS